MAGTPTRLARPSTNEVLRALGFIGPLPTDLEEKIRAVVEMRPLRPEEDFHFGIVRWSQQRTVAALAGEFGMIRFEPSGGANDPLTIHVIREVATFTTALNLRIGPQIAATPVSVIGGVFPLDGRIGGGTILEGMWESGTNAAGVPTLPIIDSLNVPAAGTPFERRVVNYVLGPSKNTTTRFYITTQAVNTALSVMFSGYTITPR